MENWKPVKGYEGQYLVSDQGRVMNSRGLVSKTRQGRGGNIYVYLKGVSIGLAKLVGRTFIPNPGQLEDISFIDGNLSNCSASNLMWTGNKHYLSTPKEVVLIKDGLIVKRLESIGATARYLSSDAVSEALHRTDTIKFVKGYAVALANDKERIEYIINVQKNPIPDLPNEEWKVIDDSSLYMVSNKGRFKSLRRHIPKLMKTTIQINGYCYVSTMINGRTKLYRLHRLVALAFLPNPNNYPEINHIDGNTLNNDVSNLEWCSQEYNLKDEWNRRKMQTFAGVT